MSIEIAPAGEQDFPALAALSARCFPEHGWRAGEFGAPHLVLVARLKGSPQGYIAATIAADEVEIQALAVEAEARRHGVASQLVQRLLTLAAAEGARQCYLEVRASNQAAQDFYRARGFIACGRRANYYSDPREDALLLSRPV